MPGGDRTREGVSVARIYLLILLTTLIWGGNPVAGKLAVQEFPLMTIGILRYGLASLALFSLFGRQFPSWGKLRRQDVWVLLGVGILGTFLNHLLFFLGLLYAPASHGAIIAPTTSPVWTMLLAARLAKERITPGQIVGTVVCILGVVLVVRPDGLAGAGTSRVLIGDLFYLLGGVAWGAYSFMSRVAMQRLSPPATLAYGMAFGCVFLAPMAALERPWEALAVSSASAWASVLYITVPGTLLAFFWWNLAIQRVGAGHTAVFTNLVPVIGVLLSWVVLGERLTAVQLVGGLLTVAGVWVCQGPGAVQAAWRQVAGRQRGVRVLKTERL
ncbi:MAG TPA: DMT family transporter [Candidatus Methylomirabilis sp.]|nr:DMT family transporter [Candidatus Methylomirabilis sp.]